MPRGVTNQVQAVVVQDKMYIHGAYDGYGSWSSIIFTVMEYDTRLKKWATLPRYSSSYFTMAVINNQLVLVGGSYYSKDLGVWQADRKEWIRPYPDMPTERSHCSAIGYNEWLVVAGGVCPRKHPVSSVDILNTSRKQWYIGPPTPVPWYSMKTAMVGDICYFMGGCDNSGVAVKSVYHAFIPNLITSSWSSAFVGEIWKEMPELHLDYSTPLSIKGSLFAVGGKDNDGRAVNAIHVYQHDVREWVKVGQLPSPRYDCVCVMISDGEMIVAGGEDWPSKKIVDRVDILLVR